jgi:purine-binding chemotaxis protein CheW
MSEDAPHDLDEGVLVFKASGQKFALPLADIVEIIRPAVTARVPLSPPELVGIANFRGAAVPIVSASALLGSGQESQSATSRIVMVRRKSIVGLMVDEVLSLSKTSDVGRMDLDGLLAKNFRFQAQKERKFEAKLRASDASEADAQNDLVYLSFELAHQEFALAIEQVEGIAILPPAVARMPRMDQAMLGAAEIDGALVPLVSLRFLLGFSPSELDQKTARVVLTRLGDAVIGVVVDTVKEILRISPSALDPVPPVLTRAKGEAQIEAICRLDDGQRLVSILAPAKFFDSDTVARVVVEAERGAGHMNTGESEAVDVEQFIIFRLGTESYGLPISAVDEVVRCPDKLTRVPIAPAFVRGLMNLRGQAVPVIDQRARFSADGASENGVGRVIVVSIDGLKTGFLVDKVSEVITVPADELSPAPELASETANVIDRIAMIERSGHMILLVDPKALLDRAEREILQSIAVNSGERHSP